ncbi:MAG: DegV family protein [Defluviitaleaceae bacterium]|nr:DegV family protein [Defluviitaleaceae bacterium]
MYKLFSDSGCDFTQTEAEKLNVGVVPFYIAFDGKTFFKEGIDISNQDYFTRLTSDSTLRPKTSQPSPQDYVDKFTPFLEKGQDILYLSISSKLSGSHASATIAADMLKDEYPGHTVKIVDSKSACIGQGLILREIVKMRDAGCSLNETIQLAQQVIKSTCVYFTLDTLEYLKRGGRVGSAAALVGGILGIRPILQVENGQVTPFEKVRSKARATKLMEEVMTKAISGQEENLSVCMGHIRSRSEAEDFMTNIESALGIEISNPIVDVGAAIGTHAGPGALAFAYCRKYDAFGELAKVA